MSRKVFNGKNIVTKLPLWKIILLWFIPPRYGFDLGHDEYSFIEYKIFRGKMYILNEYVAEV